MKRVFLSVALSVALSVVGATLMVGDVLAEPTSGPVRILSMRPYNTANGAGNVYVHVDQITLCSTDTYRIDLSWNGAREVVSTAQLAFVMNKPVLVEIDNAGCSYNANGSGWGTRIQSINIMK